jgi:hypothetical protein
MKIFEFGHFDETRGYRVLDERVVRGSSGINLVFGLFALVNGFVLKNYEVITWVSAGLALNFLVAILINPKFAPTYFLASIIVDGQTPIPIGAIQKRFAWSLGFIMTSAISSLSLLLITDSSWFNVVCFWCLICNMLLFSETAFGICIGCKIYYMGIRLKLIKEPAIKPNCMGDACPVDFK